MAHNFKKFHSLFLHEVKFYRCVWKVYFGKLTIPLPFGPADGVDPRRILITGGRRKARKARRAEVAPPEEQASREVAEEVSTTPEEGRTRCVKRQESTTVAPLSKAFQGTRGFYAL